MSDSVTEVTSVSWWGRIKRSFVGLLVGLLLVVGMVVLLFWNEGRAVQTARSLAEGAGLVVSVAAEKVDPANEGRLIHVSGTLTSATKPEDPDFGVAVEAVRLIRDVEMYQWVQSEKSETRTRIGGGEETVTTYTYAKEWQDGPVDSGAFKQPAGHANPPMELRGRTMRIEEGRLAAFTADRPVLDLVGGSRSLDLAADRRSSIDAAYPGSQMLSVADGRIYLGNDPSRPEIGDYRVSYSYVPLGPVSVVGQQRGDRFAAYQTQAGDSLLMVDVGTVPAEKMFSDAVAANKAVTWLLRVAGLLLLALGFSLVLAPLGVLADVLPFLGSVVRFGTGLIALALAALLGAATIALAWLYYRPMLSLAILAGGAAVAVVLFWLRRSKAQPAAAAPSPARP